MPSVWPKVWNRITELHPPSAAVGSRTFEADRSILSVFNIQLKLGYDLKEVTFKNLIIKTESLL
jgi:hypothetical protein